MDDLGGGLKYFLCSSLLGAGFQFDEIFQMGWNHQLVMDHPKNWILTAITSPKIPMIQLRRQWVMRIGEATPRRNTVFFFPFQRAGLLKLPHGVNQTNSTNVWAIWSDVALVKRSYFSSIFRIFPANFSKNSGNQRSYQLWKAIGTWVFFRRRDHLTSGNASFPVSLWFLCLEMKRFHWDWRLNWSVAWQIVCWMMCQLTCICIYIYIPWQAIWRKRIDVDVLWHHK